jgi:hypothetical protein
VDEEQGREKKVSRGDPPDSDCRRSMCLCVTL